MRDSAPRGEGERQEAARRRTRWLIFVALFLAGILPGFYLGSQGGVALIVSRDAIWPPALVAAFLGLYLVGVVGGGIVLGKLADELDRQRAYKAVSFAGTLMMIAYPVWYVLWRGGFVPEPIHW
ncbi:MAG TPA: hypothetical protein VGB57_04295, partial [Allosphingosinicella sp.]